MKWKKIGNFVGMVLGTAYLVAVIWLEATKKMDWKSLAGLIILFLIWGLMIFANLAAFFDNKEISFLGIKIASNKKAETETPSINPNDFDKLQKRTEKLEQDVHDVKEKLDKMENKVGSISEQVVELKTSNLQRTFASLNSASKTDQLSIATPSYKTPKLLKSFIKLKEEAKDAKYDYLSDTNYKELFTRLNNETLSNLGVAINLQMQWHHSDNLLKLDLEKDIHQAFNGEKVNFDVLNDIKKQVEKVDNDPHIPITFSKATNDLKKLEL